MAIRFVDKTPEDDRDHKATVTRPKSPGRSSTPAASPAAIAPAAMAPLASASALATPALAAPAAVAPAVAVPAVADQPGGAEVPKLPHSKPGPKVRGRKAQPARAAAPPIEPAQAPFEGLLPTLPHAKPEPKPRGRKKAFG